MVKSLKSNSDRPSILDLFVIFSLAGLSKSFTKPNNNRMFGPRLTAFCRTTSSHLAAGTHQAVDVVGDLEVPRARREINLRLIS